MANKRLFMIMLGMVLAFGFVLSGCATIDGENNGSFSSISVPAKDFTSLGLVFTENVVANNQGEVFTYYELLKQAKELGADSMVNVTIDVKRQGTKLGLFFLNKKETWYGSATAIKYAAGTLKNVTTNNTDSTTVTKEGIIMSGSDSGSSSGGSGGGSGGTSSAKKWYNPLTWFK
jgi:hypothetical protein